MAPNKLGQIVKFADPQTQDEAEQSFVILEIFLDVENPRAIVKYNDGSQFASTHTYFVSDLILAEDLALI